VCFLHFIHLSFVRMEVMHVSFVSSLCILVYLKNQYMCYRACKCVIGMNVWHSCFHFDR